MANLYEPCILSDPWILYFSHIFLSSFPTRWNYNAESGFMEVEKAVLEGAAVIYDVQEWADKMARLIIHSGVSPYTPHDNTSTCAIRAKHATKSW